MTCRSNTSQGRGHDRLPTWNPKNGGRLISQPVTSCLTNHSQLCMSRLLNNQSRRILFIDFSGGHFLVSSLRCLQLCWEVMTLWSYQRLCCTDTFGPVTHHCTRFFARRDLKHEDQYFPQRVTLLLCMPADQIIHQSFMHVLAVSVSY